MMINLFLMQWCYNCSFQALYVVKFWINDCLLLYYPFLQVCTGATFCQCSLKAADVQVHDFIYCKATLSHSRVFNLHLEMCKHMFYQLFNIAAFKEFCHEGVKWHLYCDHQYYLLYLDHHPVHVQGLLQQLISQASSTLFIIHVQTAFPLSGS